MKFLFLFIGLILPSIAFGTVFTARVDAASTTIPSSPGTALVIPGIRQIDTVLIDNRTAAEIVVNCTGTAATGSVNNMYIGNGEAWAFPDKAGFASACVLWGFAGTISTGVVVISVIGH